jgi:hypothetical protein
MNPITTMLARAKESTSPFIALFTWACVWVFGADNPTKQVIDFYEATDPLKLAFGCLLVCGSLFLGYRKQKTIRQINSFTVR